MDEPPSSFSYSDSTLPFSSPWFIEASPSRRAVRAPSSLGPIDEPIQMAEAREPVVEEISIEPAQEDLKISLIPSSWKGGAQLLPDPMYVSQLEERRGLDIRGGGWMAIDVAQSQIVSVELFKAARNVRDRRVIEAKYIDGRNVVNPSSAGFPIARGVADLKPGRFEVFENPPCLVRYSGVTEPEICEIILHGEKIRYKFEPPILAPDQPTPDFIFSSVYLEVGRGRWKKIISFNESFHPIGDPNRDGYPDFYVESVTGFNESGLHHLVLSRRHGDEVEYQAYGALFKGHRE